MGSDPSVQAEKDQEKSRATSHLLWPFENNIPRVLSGRGGRGTNLFVLKYSIGCNNFLDFFISGERVVLNAEGSGERVVPTAAKKRRAGGTYILLSNAGSGWYLLVTVLVSKWGAGCTF